MVLENLTLFEVHLDDLDLGSRRGGDDERDADAEPADESDASGGGKRRILALVGASLAMSVVVAVVASRLAGSDEPPIGEPIAVADDETVATGSSGVRSVGEESNERDADVPQSDLD